MSAQRIPNTNIGRLRFVATALGAPMPKGLPPNLLNRDGAPAHEVVAFCAERGASLDFIYLGDVGILVRYASKGMMAREVERLRWPQD